MTFFRLILDGLRHHWRSHVGVFLGVAIGAGVLTGALVIGDSARLSLKNIALGKLGEVQLVLTAGDRFFTTALSERMENDRTTVAPVILVRGVAVAEGGARRANDVQVLGVDYRFQSFAPSPPLFKQLANDEAVLNARLADKLRLRVGDEFALRMQRADAIPLEVPFLPDKRPGVASRFKVKAITRDQTLGDFSLAIDQKPPLNAFLSLDALARTIGRRNAVNLALIKTTSADAVADLNDDLGKRWRLADTGLKLESFPDGTLELTSERIFIDDAVAATAVDLDENAQCVFTYFVNAIRRGKAETPYSFVSAPGPPIVPPDTRDDEIILTRWLADDLSAKPGDVVETRHFVVDQDRSLVEKTATFTVKDVIPLDGGEALRRLTPAFPGLTDAKNCDDWDASLPLDLKKIRDKDEAYWDDHGPTPKAFVTLNRARSLWQNRYGSLTAIRFPPPEDGAAKSAPARAARRRQKLLTRLDPAELGFRFIPIRENALTAAANSVDFGNLFLGLSFFLIVAALLLTVMVFLFSVENRLDEIATLLAIGFRPATVRRLVLAEGLLAAIPGGLCGTVGGVAYAWLVTRALGGVWRGAVGVSAIEVHVTPRSLLVGGTIGVLLAAVCMGIALFRWTRKTVVYLRLGERRLLNASRRRLAPSAATAVVAAVIGAAILALTPWDGGKRVAGAFFGSGAAFLVAMLAAVNGCLLAARRSSSRQRLNVAVVALRNAVDRRGRTLTATALLACGVFLTIGVAANRHSPFESGNPASSGTGGYALYCETTKPITIDLNAARGQRDVFGKTLGPSRSFTAMRLKPGDDASCLNLNNISDPPVLGVDPAAFDDRGAFSFVSTLDGIDPAAPWTSALTMTFADDPATIPAVADQTVITWGLGKKLGDSLTYVDDDGDEVRLKLVGAIANSILQGRVVIAESNFVKAFPSIEGTRVVLADCPEAVIPRFEKSLNYALADFGAEVETGRRRLAEFSRVENTYLSIFLALGGMGIVLGTVGLGVVVTRNILERRGELATMRAIGFKRGELTTLLLLEHAAILIVGLLVGTLAGVVATLPAILASGTAIPFAALGATLAAILLNGLLWIALATTASLKKEILPDLRAE